MRKRVAVNLVSGAVTSGVALTLMFLTTHSAVLPGESQASISVPAVGCIAGPAGPQGPGCAYSPRSIALQDPAELAPLPTFEPQAPLMASTIANELRSYMDEVLTYVDGVREQAQAAAAAVERDLPSVTPPTAEAIRESVEEQVQAVQSAAPEPAKSIDVPAPPTQGTAQEMAEAIREQVQEQIDRSQTLARVAAPPAPSSSTTNNPGCTSEQHESPTSSSTAIRCVQQRVRTDGASISSVVTTSSSVSSSTTSSADVP